MNPRRILLILLVPVGVLQGIGMYIMWGLSKSFNRPCSTTHFDTLCGETHPLLMFLLLLLPFVFIGLITMFSVYGFLRLEKYPGSMNVGIWGVIGLEALAFAVAALTLLN